MTDTERAHWLAWRCGKLTASVAGDAFKVLKDGVTPAAEQKTLVKNLLAERLTGLTVRRYVNDAMKWGIAQEDPARRHFEGLTGRLVRPIQYRDHPTIDNLGATPDGALDDGLVEIKCPTTEKFLTWRLTPELAPEEHKEQMRVQCLVFKKTWVQFIAYDPRVKIEKLQMMTTVYEPSREELELTELKSVLFLSKVDAMFHELVEQASAPGMK